ncbi:MAG TPA: hypothetical protein VNA25_22560 [Phycisphaerae bacterium]|nr:hypothetical protein [Phycisphaerae bacterium]HUT60637.1 hypothetical protein [Phycisphaerae bacterium]
MRARDGLIVVLVVLMVSAPAAAEPKGIHIPGNLTTNWSWTVTDGGGFRWDIYGNGTISNGTNNAYGGAALLYVDGSSFSWSSSGKLSADRREVEVGPWQHGSLKVWRRVYVPPKGAYARWIDVFENTSGAKVTAKVRYQFSLGNSMQFIRTSTGGQQVAGGDWGFVSNDSSGSSSRPPLCHIFATKGSKILPRVEARTGNSTFYYNFDVPIPANATVALCLFEAQCKSLSDAETMLKKFRPAAGLQPSPGELRRLILNMKGSFLMLGSLELPREQEHDAAVLRNGNELLGTILAEKYVLETFYGKLDLLAERVVGFEVSPDSPSHVRLALADGQVAAGKLLTDPVRMKLQTGSEMDLQVAKIATLSYRVSSGRPEDITIARPTIVTRCGQQVYFDPADLDCTFLTQYGSLKLRPQDLAAIYMDTPEGGLHRAMFSNGSLLSGLFVQKDLKLSLALGPVMSAPASSISQFVFPRAEPNNAGLTEVTLRNENVLYGRILDEVLNIKTRFGQVSVAPRDLAQLSLLPESLNRVELKLHDGTKVSGQFAGKTLKFRLEPGPEIPLFISHVLQVACPEPPPATASTKPADGNSTSGAARTTPRATDGSETAKGIDELKKVLADLTASLRERQARMDATQKQMAELAQAGRNEEVKFLAEQMAALTDETAKLMQQVKDTEHRLAEALKRAKVEAREAESNRLPSR